MMEAKTQSQSLASRYEETLNNYLQETSENSLAEGYEIARRMLRDGYGLIDMCSIHHQSLLQVLESHQLSEALLKKAGDFFCECLSPYEMSYRGTQQGRLALRRLNELLEAELKRIAHALHDEAGQLLASVHIALADVASDYPKSAATRFVEIEQLLRQIESELGNLSHELRPTVLDNLGLVPALEALAEKISKRTGLAIVVTADGERRVDNTIETALYRVCQEALNNVVKHAGAENVNISLQFDTNTVSCKISDDGSGFAVSKDLESQGLGLLGMRERLSVLGGILHIDTAPGSGTTIQAKISIGG